MSEPTPRNSTSIEKSGGGSNAWVNVGLGLGIASVFGIIYWIAKNKEPPMAPLPDAPSNLKHSERLTGVDLRLKNFAYAVARLLGGEWTIIDGLRDEARVTTLYAQGRTSPGPIVTYAKTVNDTPHAPHGGLGRAIDMGPFLKGDVDWNNAKAFAAMGAVAKSMGLVWGGDFSNLKDFPHVETPDWRGPLVA